MLYCKYFSSVAQIIEKVIVMDNNSKLNFN